MTLAVEGLALRPDDTTLRGAMAVAAPALLRPITESRLRRAFVEAESYEGLRTLLGNACSALPPSRLGRVADGLKAMRAAGWRDAAKRLGGASSAPKADWSAALVWTYALTGIAALLHANRFVVDLWNGSLPADDEDDNWNERAHFELWRQQMLSRKRWPALSREDRALLVRPVFELAYTEGVVGVLLAMRRRWPKWRYLCGENCRAHDHLAGMTAPATHELWTTCVPPLGLGCDCRLQLVGAGARNVLIDLHAFARPVCGLWGGDKRDGVRHYLQGWLRQMQDECKEPC